MTRPKYDTVTLETPAGLRGLIDEWRRGEYIEQRRLLRRYSRKEPPRFLYKFRGLSGPYDVENLRAMLVHSVLRLNSPAHFQRSIRAARAHSSGQHSGAAASTV